mgnify:CR=1 FL=1
MEDSKVIHQTINGKYRVVFERSAVKGIDGFKVEANGDDITQVIKDAQALYEDTMHLTQPTMEVRLNG